MAATMSGASVVRLWELPGSGQATIDEVAGGSPYGATTIAGGQGQRQPSVNELDDARFQGKLMAETANKLSS